MRLKFSFFVMLAVILSLVSSSSYAAFPAKTQDETNAVIEQKSFKENLKQSIRQYKNTAPKATGMGDAADAFGIVSFVAGALGAILFFTPAGLAVIPLSIIALVFGILGLGGSHKGLALAGLILGAVEILVLILLILLVAAFLSL